MDSSNKMIGLARVQAPVQGGPERPFIAERTKTSAAGLAIQAMICEPLVTPY